MDDLQCDQCRLLNSPFPNLSPQYKVTSVLAKAVDDGRRPDLVVLGVELFRLAFGEVEHGVTQPSAFFGALPLRLPNCGEPTTVERAEKFIVMITVLPGRVQASH